MDTIESYGEVILASGQRVPCDYVAARPGEFCFISAQDLSVAEAAVLFSDANETRLMHYGEHELRGFTTLLSATREAGGAVKVALAYSGEEAT